MAAPAQADHYFIKIVIDESNYFKRDGLDVVTEADISVAQACLGGKLQLRGLFDEKVEIYSHEGIADNFIWLSFA